MIKDKKFLEKIATNCIDKAKKLGATDCEVTVSNNISETVNFRNKNIDESKRVRRHRDRDQHLYSKEKVKYFIIKYQRR